MRPSTTTLSFAVLFGCLCSSAFAGIVQQQRIDSALLSDFHPLAATLPGPDGFWAIGISGRPSVLVRYNADGTVRALRYPNLVAPPDSLHLAALSDGGAVSVDMEYPTAVAPLSCIVRRYDAQAGLSWANDAGAGACGGVFVDGAGSIWLSPAIKQVHADGSIGTAFATPGLTQHAVAVDPHAAGIFVAGSINDVSAPGGHIAQIAKFDGGGLVWTATPPEVDTNSTLLDVAVAPDGSVWGFGSKGTQLYGMHVSVDGIVLWSGAFATTVTPYAARVAVHADGTVATLHSDFTGVGNSIGGTGAEISAFDAAGTRVWHESTGFGVSASSCCEVDFALAAAANGDVFAAMYFYNYDSAIPQNQFYLQELRVDSNGAPRYSVPTGRSDSAILGLQLLPDDSTVLVGNRLEHRAIDGTPLPPASTQAIVSAGADGQAAVYGPDGSAYLLVADTDAVGFELLSVDSAGAVRWRTPVTTPPGSIGEALPVNFPFIQPRQNDVCVSGDFNGSEIVRCFALDDGHVTVSLALATNQGYYDSVMQLGITPANDLIVMYLSNHTIHHALIDSAGNLLHNVALPTIGSQSAPNAQGVAFCTQGSNSLVELAPDGTILSPQVTLPSYPSDLIPTDDGGVYVILSGTPFGAMAFDSNLAVRWQTTLPTGAANYVQNWQLLGNDIYLLAFQNSGSGWVVPGTALRQSLTDGSIVWSAPAPFNGPVVLDPAHQQMLAFSNNGARTQIERFAFADGSARSNLSTPCNAGNCFLRAAALASDGTLRLAQTTSDYLNGSAWELTTLSNDADVIFAQCFGD